MSLAAPSSVKDQAKAFTGRYMGASELAMRDALAEWGRTRWRGARLVSELTVDRGAARADLCFIGTDHFVAIEIKSGVDNMARTLHQVGHFQLATPEVWLAVDPSHLGDAMRVRSVMPSLGVASVTVTEPGASRFGTAKILPPDRRLVVVVAAPQARGPDPECMLSLLWVDELVAEARRAQVWQGNPAKPPSHAKLVAALAALTNDERIAATCRALRAREALWHADPAIREASA